MSHIRELERRSIREFLESHSAKLGGRVLDFGAGRQPYRDIVEGAGGEYVPYDDPGFPGSTVEEATPIPTGVFDAVVCTQVVQYVEYPAEMLATVRRRLRPGGWLLVTGPTNWPAIEWHDKWRFTLPGATELLWRAGFLEVDVVERASVEFEVERWCLGWAAVARG